MANLARTTPTALAPAETLRDAMRGCDPDVPLASGDPRWEDFSPARGDQAIEALGRELAWRAEDRFVHAAFVSHRGAGKSTELRRLTEKIKDSYETVILEATLEMDPFHIDAEDLLLNLAFAIESAMQTRGTPLPSELLARIRAWFDEVVSKTTWAAGFHGEAMAGVEVKAGIPFSAAFVGSFKALFKQENEYRSEVKSVLRKYPGALIQSVNDLLDAANLILGTRPLLVVVDNLDRYEHDVIDRLLVVGADRIRSLRCNLILTPPIGLLLKPKSAQLDQLYSCHFLYAIRLRSPKQAYDLFDGPGRDLMEQALAHRINLDVVVPEKAARDRLISASGGAIRELLDLVSQSALLASGEVILEADAERAIAKRRQRLRDLINANGWMPTLVTIAQDKQISADPRAYDVLFHYLAFKYNGDGWYDVHPLVTEIPEFQSERRGEAR